MVSKVRAYLCGNISSDELIVILEDKLGAKNVTTNFIGEHVEIPKKDWSSYRFFGDKGSCRVRKGKIEFLLPNNEYKELFVYYSDAFSTVYDKEYIDKGLDSMIKSDKTFISMDCLGNAVTVIKSIVEMFGGWIDEDDSDNKSFHSVKKYGCL